MTISLWALRALVRRVTGESPASYRGVSGELPGSLRRVTGELPALSGTIEPCSQPDRWRTATDAKPSPSGVFFCHEHTTRESESMWGHWEITFALEHSNDLTTIAVFCEMLSNLSGQDFREIL